ncbi:MAG: glycoside hydrolase family 31 protein [Prolixibacteraceae bacterium]|nr:glycoside hydrolase family 31 protein [Prolixibacteraceae bacterium]
MSFYLLVFSASIFAQQANPLANQAAVIETDNARFTVLTPDVIRMEHSADGFFEDQATLTFVNRNLPVPEFTKEKKDGWLVLKTSALTLRYKIGSDSFKPSNLFIDYTINAKEKTWNIDTPNKGNLRGTTRTLDGATGNMRRTHNNGFEPVQLDKGLISRDGWVLIDDSKRPLFDNSDWQWVNPRPKKKAQDLYFFYYDTDYKKALYNYSQLAGKMTLPPKFAFGIWWSRYWEYSDVELKRLVEEFRLHDVPLDVLVIDMDWHIVNRPEWFDDNGKRLKDQSGGSYGWTGYTWNKSLFPDPEGFLKWTNDNNIKTCLNLHPASGVQPHEAAYEKFAKSMGIDPATKKHVPFEITNKNYAKNYMEILLHPIEEDGIDFWWLDWQQWGSTKIDGVNPTFYLNYVHTSDMERRGIRPLIYHRWGGLGNHRYQIGFSGDININWESLNYQPYFTATASNVLYGFWSHDIGGYGYDRKKLGKGFIETDPELYTRWVQWGAFSPILRTHCTKDPYIERKIWEYPANNFYSMRDAMKLRYSLFPYIYTNARIAYDSGVSLMRPMYYEHPKNEHAYNFTNQYMFGDDLLVSPITKPMKKDSVNGNALFVSQKIWLPKGEWFEWNSGTLIQGDQIVERPYMINEIPLYVRSGAIIPMQPDMNRIGEKAIDPFIINIFPGKSGKTSVYDDAGNDLGFKKDEFTHTNISFEKKDQVLKAQILPIVGKFEGMPEARSYEIRLPLTYVPTKVKVNGKAISMNNEINGTGWQYDGSNLMTVIRTERFSVNERVEVEVVFPDLDPHELSGLVGKANKVFFASTQVIARKNWNHKVHNFDDIRLIAQTLNRITIQPENKLILDEKAKLENSYEAIIEAFEKNKANAPTTYVPIIDLLESAK